MNINPYNPLEPTTDATLFFGRKDAIAFFQRHLAGAVYEKALVLLGQRGMGKSSLLSQIPLHIDERYVCIWVDVSSLDLEDETGLVATIVDLARVAMEAIDASTYRLPDYPDPAEIDVLDWLANEYLDVVLTAIRRERHFVIMLDDTHLLVEAVKRHNFRSDFFDYLQNLMIQHERLDIIAAFDILYEGEAINTAPFDDTTLHYRLLYLQEEAARALITVPVADQITYDAAALKKLHKLAGGHPFHIHSLCRLLYRLWQERKPDGIGLAEIEAVYTAALEQAGDVVEPLWHYARPNERLALTALVDLRAHNDDLAFPMSAIQDWLGGTEFDLNHVQLGAALRSLEYLGLIDVDERGNYSFAADLQGDWLLKYTDILPQQSASATPLPTINRQMMIGGLLIVVLIALLGIGMLASGDQEKDNEADDLPPTSTLTINEAPTEMPIFRFGG